MGNPTENLKGWGTRCAAEIRTVSPANILRFSAQLGCQSPQKAQAAGGRSTR
jgi:hypothetical protein